MHLCFYYDKSICLLWKKGLLNWFLAIFLFEFGLLHSLSVPKVYLQYGSIFHIVIIYINVYLSLLNVTDWLWSQISALPLFPLSCAVKFQPCASKHINYMDMLPLLQEVSTKAKDTPQWFLFCVALWTHTLKKYVGYLLHICSSGHSFSLHLHTHTPNKAALNCSPT